MGSRYGRRKRRADRERIAALQTEADSYYEMNVRLQRQILGAEERGANAILKARYLDEAVRAIVAQLTDRYGHALMKAADELIRSHRGAERPLLEIRYLNDPADVVVRTITIEGRIPALHYCVKVAQL